jgi:hypothetical protein
MISAVNLGKINADPKEREARLERWSSQLHPVRGATASDLFAEAERHTKDWKIGTTSSGLKHYADAQCSW